MFKVNVYNQEGKELKKLELDKDIFDGSVNKACLYQVLKVYQANARRGMASTKTRGEVSGGGKKPWAQKGTGRARHGSTRSPIWRHGGVVFGPHPRDFSRDLPKAIRRASLISSINVKLKENQVIVVDKMELNIPKTKKVFDLIKKLKLNESSLLFIISKTIQGIERAARNIPNITLIEPDKLNAQIVLAHRNLLLTEASLKELSRFLKK